MKKIYAALLVLISFTSYGQIINFPDANFKAKLLQPGGLYDYELETSIIIDANNDGEIEVSEIQPVRYLDISNCNIADLTGISYFTNLKWLNCSNNVLQNIMIGNGNSSLKGLNCSNNLLQTISIDHSITLRSFGASHNQLTSGSVDILYDHSYDPFEYEYLTTIDLSYNNLTSFTADGGDYTSLNCSYNPLTAFDLNGSIIEDLVLNFTSLTSITGTGQLKYANFQNNQFTLLDLTNISFYWPNGGSIIFLGNNPVDKAIFGASSPGNLTYSSTNSSFDLTNFRGFNYCRYHWQEQEMGNVRIIDCPNLNFLSMKNGLNYGNINCFEQWSQEAWTQSTLRLNITNCPSLSFICVDEGEQDHIQEKINALGLQNQVQVNSYCSFVPGGTFYTINGNNKFDANSNGCDMADAIIPNFKFSITSGNSTGVIVSNDFGNYSIPVQSGTQTITPILENATYFNVSPATLSVTFPADASPFTQNFCITANEVHNDLEMAIIPVNTARPGFDAKYKITYKNKGTQPQSGTISFVFNDAVLDLVTSNPTVSSQVVNNLNWDFSNLQPFETRAITVTLNANSPMEVPSVNGGDILNFTASINSSLTDEITNDNTFVLNQTVVNSFDPNDKTCLEGNVITPEMVGKEVHYMIRFENTGTANAENIVVKDMIDTEKFDIDSLIPIDGSHPFITRISNTNKVEFIFENINLPFDDANNDGYVAFKIKTKPSLVLGDTFSNTASIYFDYNFPIITNNATTTVALLANQDFAFEQYFKIYPNPVKDILNIETKKTIEVTSVNIYNTLGQLVLVIPNAQQTKSVDVSSLKTGNYLMKINSNKGSSSVKFVKD
ncbi:T9SS type A sorting domain-containing protein [Flavobacterium sp.]|uniref:T9SS type A sorting domain-containing protein n=1 Tax=Flavobacterium sp. TaxID=239 RepID=UPI00286AAC16|nr:T9SS type A sorting domain-containing protein [Flavobacterium sp.]